MPMGILYMAAYIKAKLPEAQTAIVDLAIALNRRPRKTDVCTFLNHEISLQAPWKPDIVAVSCLFSASHDIMERVISISDELWPEARIVAGGHHPSALGRQLLENPSLDAVVTGEGEIPLLNIVRKLHIFGKSATLNDISNVISRDAEFFQQSENCCSAGNFPDLDCIPLPYWNLIDMDSYTSQGRRRPMDNGQNCKAATMITSRGCPFQCTFCASHRVHGRKMRLRSTDSIISEMVQLKRLHDVDMILFEDDLFTALPDRTIEILDAMKIPELNNMKIQFPNGLSVNSMTISLAKKLADSGMSIVNLAVESGSEYVQSEIIRKKVNLNKARELISVFRNLGCIVRCYFILGFPGETAEMMDQTISFAHDCGCDWSVFSIATPLPGSEMYDQFIARGEISHRPESWNMSNYFKRCFDTAEITANDLMDKVFIANMRVNFAENINLRNGDFTRALRLFKDVIHLHPEHPAALDGIARCQMKLEDPLFHSTLTAFKSLIKNSIQARNDTEKCRSAGIRFLCDTCY